jgi:protein-S-isoprenylcysteine O-methyltransferase Ste14
VVSLLAFLAPMLALRREPQDQRRTVGSRLPVVANFAAVGLFYSALLLSSGSLHAQSALPLATSGAILAIAAGALVFGSRAELGTAWSLAPKADQSTGLVTTGPYSLIRHPIYAGFVLLAIGQALAFANVLALAIVALGVLPTFFWRARTEEQLLRQAFDDRYDRYRTQTKMIIPFVF